MEDCRWKIAGGRLQLVLGFTPFFIPGAKRLNMFKIKIIITETALLAFLTLTGVYAMRPLVTDDVDIIKSYHYLFEFDGEYRDFGKKNIQQVYRITLGKTFFDDYEFSVHIPYEGRIVSPWKTWGIGDLLMELKWKWLDEAIRVPGLGLRFGVKLPTGQDDDTAPTGTGTTDIRADILLQKSVPYLTLYGNIGYTARTGNDEADRIRAGFGSRHPLGDKTDIFAEIYGTTSTQPAQRDDTLDFYIGIGHQTRWDWRWDIGSTMGFTTSTPDWSVRWGSSAEF